MKALSVKQPWANLIANKQKGIEIRTWGTNYRGPLFIHTGQSVDLEGARLFKKVSTLPRGVIIARTELTLVVEYTKKRFIEDQQYHLNPVEWYREGLYGWLLENQQRFFHPISYKGSQGLFEVNLND